MKAIYNGVEISEKEYISITAKFLSENILPFKKGLNEGQSYVGVIEKFDGNLSHNESFFLEHTPEELRKFDGYVMSISGNGIWSKYFEEGDDMKNAGGAWFELFNKEDFKKDIDTIVYKINEKKIACKFNGYYSWAVKNEDLSVLMEIANKYKLIIR